LPAGIWRAIFQTSALYVFGSGGLHMVFSNRSFIGKIALGRVVS
jgi:hypothetical protein